eukprot:COSAG06_NODE_26005_length_624_cov_0.763810_1_plen_59_part_10
MRFRVRNSTVQYYIHQEENGELKNEFRQVIGGPLRQPPPLAITIPSAQVAIVRRRHIAA